MSIMSVLCQVRIMHRLLSPQRYVYSTVHALGRKSLSLKIETDPREGFFEAQALGTQAMPGLNIATLRS